MKKILISVLLLVIVLCSIGITYTYLNQPSSDTNPTGGDSTVVTDGQIDEEVDGFFLDPDSDVTIGDIV
jgi:hypothetical protein